MKGWWVVMAIVLIVLAMIALAGCKERPNDYKGRPVPRASTTCWDNSVQKNVGPWVCDNHGGKR